ncbi:DUF2938 domain-containing protein [Diaphorobacter sp. HDW4A]|uniref:DUF2938 family protein n=1 Tax=Diaphorobacter sp. HDW4A TaxID=2714924 RepID=UPI0014074962|nr:DUF2938 family protein [Diaphorobacter sp. HDW4A]QIL79693.1 DUF2938 domain-containing protein [Diaphorobacter sp. HDW4A]
MSDWKWWGEAFVVGIGATALMDLWSWTLRRIGIATLDYAMLGRWCKHWLNGTWFHASIQKSPPTRFEKPIGWALHYLTGIAFATLWLTLTRWPPSGTSALLFGAITVLVPWLVLQPALGAGIASSRTARPWMIRAVGLLTHVVFGAGMWMVLWVCSMVSMAGSGRV